MESMTVKGEREWVLTEERRGRLGGEKNGVCG